MRTITITLTAVSLLTAAAFALNEMTLVAQYEGEAPEDWFGDAMTMGDFDDDGHDEYIIGAQGWNNNMGKNYYYDWQGDWPAEPAWTFQGTEAGSIYDWIDENVGDINGDGIDDFGISETDWGEWARFDLLYGAADFDSVPDWSMLADLPAYNFGNGLDSCGDVNGDGGNDFIFRASFNTDDIWEIRIYFGGEVLDTIPDWTYPGYYYFSISGLGDVNGDGFADILLLSPNYQPPLLFFGGSPMDTIPDLVFYEFAMLGNGGGVGDVNGDGYNDFCMAMWLPDSSTAYDMLYLGGPYVDNIPDAVLQNRFGELWGSLNGISHGDFNGDGYSDVVSQTGDLYWGDAVYIYLGSPLFNPVPDALMTDYSVLHDFGNEVAAGDVNNDGNDEILVAATNTNYPFHQGTVYLYTGPEEWIDYGAPVEPGDLPRTPGWYKLEQNFPNPFNASTTIHFELGKLSIVSITIYDLQGNKIRELIKSKEMRPGGYNVSWSGRNQFNQPVSSGIYLLELQVDQFKETRKMVLIR